MVSEHRASPIAVSVDVRAELGSVQALVCLQQGDAGPASDPGAQIARVQAVGTCCL